MANRVRAVKEVDARFKGAFMLGRSAEANLRMTRRELAVDSSTHFSDYMGSTNELLLVAK